MSKIADQSDPTKFDVSKKLTAQEKLRTLPDVASIATKLRELGGKIVLAHGTFDLIHIGHLRHLQQARRQGTFLIVTITADKFVNRGPGRPIFSENMRAEMLAEFECVNCVAISNELSATTVISSIRPHVFVKGMDYSDPNEDLTGGIEKERQAIEACGGDFILTEDITFSSTSLINRHLSAFDPNLKTFLDEKRKEGILQPILKLIKEAASLRVLIIGDAIIDDYNYVTAMGKSPKEQIISAQFAEREVFAGGAVATANHVAGLCQRVEIITMLGSTDSYESLIRSSLKSNVNLTSVCGVDRPTTRKVRFIDQSYLRKMFEVYHMNDAPIDTATENNVISLLEKKIDSFDVIIVNDFGHGFITENIIQLLQTSPKFTAVNAQSNSANMGFNLVTKYNQADYVCVDLPEARLAVNDRVGSIEEITKTKLASAISCSNIIVTNGRNGCCGFKVGEPLAKIPAFTINTVDTLGAGDAFFAISAPMAALGAPVEQTAFVGNAAGALKVGIVGHRSAVEKGPLAKFLTTLLK